MQNNTTKEDRTGHKIEPTGSPVGIVVVSKVIGAEIYVCQDYIVAEPDSTTGAYFITAKQLEETIKGYEDGDWGYEI